MSQETREVLNQFQLVSSLHIEGADESYLVKQADGSLKAWHFNEEYQGDEANHYDGFIPTADVHRRLFNWLPVERGVHFTVPSDEVSAELAPNVVGSFPGPDGVWLSVVADPQRKLIVRSDTNAVLGAFKDGYKPHPYGEWLVGNIAVLLGEAEGELGITSAGLLKGGAVAYVQIAPKEATLIGGEDKVVPLITAATSFDGSIATNYSTTALRPVCDNSLSAAIYSSVSRVAFKHTRYSGLRVAEAREALGVFFSQSEAFTAEVEALMNQAVTDAQFEQIVKMVHPDPHSEKMPGRYALKLEKIQGLWENDPRVANVKGTAWGVMQALNTYAQHEAIFRSTAAAGTRFERTKLNTVTGIVDKTDGEVLAAMRELELVSA